MGNSFNISVAPEIAALSAQVTVVDAVVDAIRATDVPLLDGKLDTVDAVADAIRATDVPLLDGKLDTIDTVVDSNATALVNLDTLVDTVLSNLYPQTLTSVGLKAGAGYVDAVNVTGQGILLYLWADNDYDVLVTLDGVAASPTWNNNSGDNFYGLLEHATTTGFIIIDNIIDSPFLLNLSYSTSLRVQVQGNSALQARCKVWYTNV